nr:efflux RND transporter periplasmic adaptor subunit [Paenibacillus hamazuiensis]
MEKIAKQKIAEPLELPAEVLSSVQIDALAKTGGDVGAILKKRGDLVEEGEVIVKLSSEDADRQRTQAQLSLQNAQEAIELAAKETRSSKLELDRSVQKLELEVEELTKKFNKLRNDYDRGKGTKAELNQAEVELKKNQMDLDALKQKQKTSDASDKIASLKSQQLNAQLALQQAEQVLANLEVKSPVSGILTDLPVVPGMTVQAGSRVGQVVKLDPIKIKVLLNEETAKIARGKTELTYYVPGSEQKSKGKITYVSAVIDPQTKAYELNLEVPNKDMALKPGMRARVQLSDESEQTVLAVPLQSVIREPGGETFVFVNSGDIAEKRQIQLGRSNDFFAEVLSGVKEGEMIVVSGKELLKDKDKIPMASAEGRK